MSDALFARYTDDLFRGITPTGTAPAASYTLATLTSGDPARRVRWSAASVTITFTIASARGDVLVIPVANLVGAVLTLTNGAGLSVPITPPLFQANGIPRTIAVDLTLLASAGTRTSTTWNLVIVSNPANVIFGGAVALYGERRLLPKGVKREGIAYRKQQAVDVTTNEYLTKYRVNHATSLRVLDCRLVVPNAQLDDLEDWHDANAGQALPGLLWTGLTELDAFYGLWLDRFVATKVGTSAFWEVTLSFEELSKGKPV